MAPTNAIAGPEVHDRGIMQLAPELTIDGPQQDGYSGLPIAIVEAGLLGAPTVAFDCAPGIRELIESGRNGIVVPVPNIKILAEEMLRLARDESLLSTLSRHCAEDMQRYSPSAIVDRWENLFVEMSR
ncbi:glycosyltransferase [Brevibacterium aurantiacum]|uniref:glycosyltransferase n=1 Tax=Brevibacterium aurantiacum TaxID=273384 RepID=UPI000C79164C|nr:glycosyltransferase [Brevibacterium aurantiacum]